MDTAVVLETDIYDQITAALREKANLQPCSFCGERDWTVRRSLHKIGAATNLADLPASAGFAFVIVVYCGNCGKMHFLDPTVLGVGHLIPQDWTPI